MKRIFDVVLTLWVLLVFAPLLLLVALLIKINDGGRVLFYQQRLGKDGHIFELMKFRSMSEQQDRSEMQTLPGDAEVTVIGQFIRRFKIDELPQLFNVLKGDMSIVGPRPCLLSLQKTFNEDGKMRLNVRPGLTGLAQINGNIYLSWEERWAFDRKYVETQSLLLDLYILIKTVYIVFFGEKKGLKNK